MQFTTQKQQLKESRRVIREERLALAKRVFQTVFGYACCCLVIIAPTLAAALGWIKG